MIFVNSMSDLFHKEIPRSFIARVFDTMERAHWHTFQVLTKRSSLMRDFLQRPLPHGNAAPCICGLVSRSRMAAEAVANTPSPAGPCRRALSFDRAVDRPGGQARSRRDRLGDRRRRKRTSRPPMKPDWVREIRDQCRASEVAFFFKQWGGLRPKSGGRKLDGREWNQFPSASPSYAVAASRHGLASRLCGPRAILR